MSEGLDIKWILPTPTELAAFEMKLFIKEGPISKMARMATIFKGLVAEKFPDQAQYIHLNFSVDFKSGPDRYWEEASFAVMYDPGYEWIGIQHKDEIKGLVTEAMLHAS